MRNKHAIKTTVEIRCPYEDCGKKFKKAITVIYWTNQRGDVIDHQISTTGE